MSWDVVLMGASLVLNVATLPTLLRPSYVPRATSALFTVAITVIALTLHNLGSDLGATANVIGAGLWGLVFIFRGRRI